MNEEGREGRIGGVGWRGWRRGVSASGDLGCALEDWRKTCPLLGFSSFRVVSLEECFLDWWLRRRVLYLGLSGGCVVSTACISTNLWNFPCWDLGLGCLVFGRWDVGVVSWSCFDGFWSWLCCRDCTRNSGMAEMTLVPNTRDAGWIHTIVPHAAHVLALPLFQYSIKRMSYGYRESSCGIRLGRTEEVVVLVDTV